MFGSYTRAIKYALINNNKNEIRVLLKLNRFMLSSSNCQVGGTGNVGDALTELHTLFQPLTSKIDQIDSSIKKFEDLVEIKKQFKELIEFVTVIHGAMPNDVHVKEMEKQLSEINTIINKYQ